MTRKLLFAAFLSTLALTFVAAHHQLTNAAPNMAPPPKNAPPIESMTGQLTAGSDITSTAWSVVAGGGGKYNLLHDVGMVSADEGWAVGVTWPSSYGVIMHYTNTTWSRVQPPNGAYGISAVKMTGPTEGWATGYRYCEYLNPCDEGVLLHYTTASGWQTATLPARPDGRFWGQFYAIDIKGDTGWVGSTSWSSTGESYFLKFDGMSWTPITTPLTANGISVIDASEAWAVGVSTFNVPNIGHYSSGSWSLVTLPTLPTNTVLKGIHMLNANDGWAVGYARPVSAIYQCVMLHYIGGAWVSIACPPEVSTAQLFSVRMRSSTDVWAVGRIGGSWPYYTGVILHYDGSTWTRVPVPSGTNWLASVRLVGADDGWSVGMDGAILRLVNGNWVRAAGSGLSVGVMDALGPREVWYGGYTGELFQWQNGSVVTYASGIPLHFSALDMVSSTLGFAGTSSGSSNYLIKFSDGAWSLTPLGTARVNSISMINPSEGWAALNTGIWHYSSGTWQPQSSAIAPNSISMLDSSHGWAVRSATVYTFTNGTWAAITPALGIPSGTWASLKVIGISPDEAWVAGWIMDWSNTSHPVSPQLYHFMGGTWEHISTAEWLAFFDISQVSATEWWAAGKLTTQDHAFLHYKDGVYTVVAAAGEDVQAVSMLPSGSGFASGIGSLLRLDTWANQVYLPIVKR